MEMQGYESGIKKARTALFVTAFLVLLGEVLTVSMAGLEWTPLMIGIVAIEVGIFVALALWTKTKPYTATVVGLIVFVLYWIAAIALNGTEAAYKGIIVKVIIIVTLVQAIKPAKAWEDTKKTL
jgi:glucose dehydrogenase